MKLTNQRMDEMTKALDPFLDRNDLIGYAAARNVRLLTSELIEFYKIQDELVRKHGTEDDEGNVNISPTHPNWAAFVEEYAPIASMEHDFDPFTISIDEAKGELSGRELLSIDFMFEES